MSIGLHFRKLMQCSTNYGSYAFLFMLEFASRDTD